MPIFSVTKFSELEVNREERKHKKKYNAGMLDMKVPNMENIFIKHIFNKEWRENNFLDHDEFTLKMMNHSEYSIKEIKNITYEMISTRKFLMYIFVLANKIPLPKVKFIGKYKDHQINLEHEDSFVIKKDNGKDNAFTLCVENKNNLYLDGRELAWQILDNVKLDDLVIIEELLKNKESINNKLKQNEVGLVEYHVYSFDGNVRYINIMTRNIEREVENSYWYDLHYNMGMNENIEYDLFPTHDELKTMLDYTYRLRTSKPMFMRVTYYITNKGIKFGDFTFQPSNFFRGWKLLRMEKNIIDLFAEEMETHGIYLF